MGIQLLHLELRLGKIPSRSFRPVKSAEILWQFWASSSFGVSLAHEGFGEGKWEPPCGGEVNSTRYENDLYKSRLKSDTLDFINGEGHHLILPITLQSTYTDDPYMAVRHAYLATITDSKSKPFEDSRETEIPQPLPISSSPVPPLDDPYLIVGQTHTDTPRQDGNTRLNLIDTKSGPEEAPLETSEFQPLAARTAPPSLDCTPTSSDPTPVSRLTNEEFEASEPSDTRITSSHSTAPSNSTTPLSPDHLLTQTSPIPTRVSYYHSTTRMVVLDGGDGGDGGLKGCLDPWFVKPRSQKIPILSVLNELE
ncbi:hypothetical protein Tco_1578060 [Tanacetum coccineum]